MRILVVHNQYRSALPSGENRVVADEVGMLRAAGVEVHTYFRSSDEIEEFGSLEKLTLPLRPIYSFEDARAFRARLRELRPDVIHLHNPFPLISPWVVRVSKQEGAPVVQTVHNYRHSCPAGVLFRDGNVCEECVGKTVPWPAVQHGCYRGSRAQSAVMATTQSIHRSTWRMVDQFLPVSDFVAQNLMRYGIPQGRITVKPDAIADPGPPAPLGEGFLFAARLSSEKGIKLLLDAWAQSGLGQSTRLVIAGDGPERDRVEAAAARLPGVEYVGLVDQTAVTRLISEAAVVVVPSTWYEAFSLQVVQAFAAGRPVLATRMGNLASIIDPAVGWHAEADPESLATALARATPRETAQRLGVAARARYEHELNPLAVTTQLLEVYARVADRRA